VYDIGAALGRGLKLFLSAFETAWAPFYFREMNAPDAQQTFRALSTYVFGVLVLLVAGLAAVSQDLVRLMTAPRFHGAGQIVPWIGLGVGLQGIYLLTSIGLNITKRTAYYPVTTGLATVAALGANLMLVPRFGAIGAAWSNVIAYGVLAAAGMAFSQRFYPIRYEWARVWRLVAAGVLAAIAGQLILGPAVAPLSGVLVRGTCAVAADGIPPARPIASAAPAKIPLAFIAIPPRGLRVYCNRSLTLSSAAAIPLVVPRYFARRRSRSSWASSVPSSTRRLFVAAYRRALSVTPPTAT